MRSSVGGGSAIAKSVAEKKKAQEKEDKIKKRSKGTDGGFGKSEMEKAMDDLDEEEDGGLDLELHEALMPAVGEVGILLTPEEKDIPDHLKKQREEVQQNFQLPTKSHAEVLLIVGRGRESAT